MVWKATKPSFQVHQVRCDPAQPMFYLRWKLLFTCTGLVIICRYIWEAWIRLLNISVFLCWEWDEKAQCIICLLTLFKIVELFLSLILQFLPLPSVAGFYLARFFTKKSLPSYFGFVVLGSLMVTWFVMHNFWDLNIWLAGMSLKSFCKFIIANVVLSMAIPGLAILPSKLHFLTEVGLISHALLLCYIENRFFNYSSIYYYGFEDEVMYPSYMVVVTTFVGLALVRRLSVDHRIGPKAAWILTCLYSSKLAMLLITSKSVVWMSAVLLLAISPPVLLYKYLFCCTFQWF